MFQAIQKLFGTSDERYITRTATPKVAKINALEESIKKLSDDQLRGRTQEFRQKLEQGASVDDLLIEVFATVREAGVRALNMRHYDVQLIGGMVLHEGKIAEMKTGEGKTLVATLPAYLNALSGKGAHLITVNDYLAQRDSEWMGRLYRFLGLSVGVIINNLGDVERRNAYGSDITYGTNNEFGFDYLRDNMKYSLDRFVQRDLHFGIIDEVDSILVDEARTPLIISGDAGISTELPFTVNQFIPFLRKDEDYLVDEEHRSVSLTDIGVEKIEAKMEIPNLYEPANIDVVHAVVKALQAHTLYKKDERYIVQGDEVVIVDEFTGRPMPGRRWSDGLHQAVEAKEGVKINDENQTLATVTFQNFFRMYDKLSGMTGTAETEAEEFYSIYKLPCTVVPTNKPVIRGDHEDLVYRSYREKFGAIVDQIAECNERQQPVLVGTTSVEKSEALSHVLGRRNVNHSVLNAKHHESEAQIVSQAGRKGSVTIATNMAGRGTDIVLGGNPETLAADLVGAQEVPDDVIGAERQAYYTEDYKDALGRFEKECAIERQEVLDSGGLFIIGTERHESRRIDNQLRGRSGRQGDPGESRFFLSLEDDLLRLFGAERIAKVMDMVKMEEGVPIEHKMVTRSIENAQTKVEGRNFDIRKNLLEYDDVMDVQRKSIYSLRKAVLNGVDQDGNDIRQMTIDLFEDVALTKIDEFASRAVNAEDWDVTSLKAALGEIFPLDFVFESSFGRDQIEREVWGKVSDHLAAKQEMVREAVERINQRQYEVRTALEQRSLELEEEDIIVPDVEVIDPDVVFEEQVQVQYIRAIDRYWRQHLQAMEQLRDEVRMRGYAQKDPKQEYKREGYALFRALLIQIKTNLVTFVATFDMRNVETIAPPPLLQIPNELVLNREPQAKEDKPQGTFKHTIPKFGRNESVVITDGSTTKTMKWKKAQRLIESGAWSLVEEDNESQA